MRRSRCGENGIDLMKHVLAPVDVPGIFISGYGGDELPGSAALLRRSYSK